jgi:hypothetical protein
MASSKCSGECGPGNFSKSGESECRVCGISEYSTGGNEACTICGEYETTAIKGASKCVCQTGFFANPSTGGGGTAVADEKLVCTKCPVGFECDRPGVVVASAKLESGFWRSDNASLRALPCPSRDSCNSSAVNGTGGCVLGNEGPFCSLCSKNFTRFSEAADCKPCPSGEDEGSAVAALIAIIAGCLAAVVLYALFNHVIPKGVLKPFINGMQYLTIVMTTSTAKRPEIVDSMLKTLSVFSFDFDVMSLSCMGVDYDYGTKLVGMVTLVAGLMLCPLLHLLRLRSKALRREPKSWFNKLATPGSGSLRKELVKTFLIKKLKVKKDEVEEMVEGVDTNDSIDLPTFAEFVTQGRDHRTRDIRALVVRDVMLVILLFHPFVSGLAMKAWKCTPVKKTDEPVKYYLTTDMTIQCFSSSNWIGIAVFSAFTIIFFSLGAPAFLFYTLARRRDQLGEKDTFKSLGILYSEWRPKYYYFESVELIFKLLLWVAVVASKDEQIQNAAVVSLLIVFVMVRVGPRPSIKRWKDKAEVCALGFSLTLKLHDMVHSYLTASKKTSIDTEQEVAWQAIIDESDTFLVGLFVSLAVFIALRGIMIVVDSDQFKSVLRSLLKKRACRRCLLRICCGCKGKCCRLFCRDLAEGEGGQDGTVQSRRNEPTATGAREVYRLSSVEQIRSRNLVEQLRREDCVGGASRSDEDRGENRDSGATSAIEMRTLGSLGSAGASRGGSSVAPVSDPITIRPNPMYGTGSDTNHGTSNGPRTATATTSATTKRRKPKAKRALEHIEYERAHKEQMKRRNASSRWDLLRTTVRAKSISRGDLGVEGVGGYTHVSFFNDVVAAAREDEEEGQLGATNQSSNHHRRRVVETLSKQFNERTLKALIDERTLKALSEMVREALGRRGTAATEADSKSIMVRNPSFGRNSLAARRRIELEGVGTAEGDAVADTSLNVVGTTTGESKGSDGDEAARGGIAARNQEFFPRQGKGKEHADAKAVQEKPDTQYNNPMVQQQQQRQQQMAAAVDSYDVFDIGAERTVPPGGGKDTQYDNPMMQQQQQQARQGAEEAETAEEERGIKNHMIREQTRTYNAAGGRGKGGARGGDVQPLHIDAGARSTSTVLE